MALCEKVLEVALDDGTKVPVTIQTLTRRVRKQINKLIAPEKLNTEKSSFDIAYNSYEKYEDEYVRVCIKSPTEAASYGWLDNLPSVEFNKLLDECQKLNGDVK